MIAFDEDKSLWFYFWNQTKYCDHQSPSSQNNGVVLYQICFLIVMVEKFKSNRCDFHGWWAHGSRLEIYLPPHWVRLASQICQSRWWTIRTHVGVSHNRCGTVRGSLHNRCTLGGHGVAEQNNRNQSGQSLADMILAVNNLFSWLFGYLFLIYYSKDFFNHREAVEDGDPSTTTRFKKNNP